MENYGVARKKSEKKSSEENKQTLDQGMPRVNPPAPTPKNTPKDKITTHTKRGESETTSTTSTGRQHGGWR